MHNTFELFYLPCIGFIFSPLCENKWPVLSTWKYKKWCVVKFRLVQGADFFLGSFLYFCSDVPVRRGDPGHSCCWPFFCWPLRPSLSSGEPCSVSSGCSESLFPCPPQCGHWAHLCAFGISCLPSSFIRATSPLWRLGFLVKCFAFPEALPPGSLVFFMLLYFKDCSGLMGN